MGRISKYIICVFIVAFATNFVSAQTNPQNQDSIPQKKDSLNLRYNFKHGQTGNLLLKYPSKFEVIYDKSINKYIIVEKVGDYYIKTPIFMTPEEYKKYVASQGEPEKPEKKDDSSVPRKTLKEGA